MRKLATWFWMLTVIIGITNSITAQDPSATLTSDSILYDFRLDRAVLTINLSNEMFIDYTSLETSDFVLQNYPPGLTIDSVQGISPTEVDIDLAFDGTDIDMDYLLRVGIRHTVLENTDTLELYTNSLCIAYYLENPAATLIADSILTEQNLDSRTLTIDLYEEMFVNYNALNTSNFALVNAPEGLTIESVQGISPTQALINLAFNGTDFDTNIPNFRLDITSSVLIQTVYGYLATNPLIIFSLEPPEAFMTDDSILYEPRLDWEYLTIDLKNEMFIEYTALKASDFILVNMPMGFSIKEVHGISPNQAIIDLIFDGTDFDTNYTDFRVGINHSVLKYTETGVLYTNSLVIHAYVENPFATLSSDSTMYESRLDYRILTINLSEEMFLDYTSLKISDFALINAPAGLTIDTVTGTSPTQAVLDLAFDQTDFDVTITDFRIQISSQILIQTTSGYLITNNLSIFPSPENSLFSIPANNINFKEWNYNQRKIVRTPEIGIVAESNKEILFSYNLNAPVKIFDGENASLAVDKNSNIHIVYEDNGIKYSSKPRTGNWQTSLMISDSSETGFPPVADCDKDGNVHILYAVKDSCDNGKTYLCSLKYVKVTNNQPQISSLIYDMTEENDPDTLINYTIATDLLFMDKTIFIAYQLSNDSIYILYSTDSGESWTQTQAFPGINPSLSVGFGRYVTNPGITYNPYPIIADEITCPVVLYMDADSNLLHRYAEFSTTGKYFNWHDERIIQNGPINFSCIDDIIIVTFEPNGYSYIFQKNGVLYHAFETFHESIVLNSITNKAIVASIAYKQFNSEKVDILWYEKNGDTYEMYYQWFEKTGPQMLIGLDSTENIKCNGSCDGSIIIGIVGGIPPYTASLSGLGIYPYLNQSLTDSTGKFRFDNLCAGTYKLTVHDVFRIPMSLLVILPEPPPLALSATVTDVTCNGGSDGSITPDIIGGVSPYQLSWCTGEPAGDLLNLPAGKYCILVSDANGCTIEDTIVIHEPPPVITGDIIGNTSVQQSSIESYSVNVTSGSTYNWGIINGNLISGQGSSNIQVQWGPEEGTGIINVFQINKDRCIGDTASLGVTINTSFTLVDCNGDTNGTAFIDSCGLCAGGNTGITPVLIKENCINLVKTDGRPCLSVLLNPNPVRDILHVKLSEENGILQIMDISGNYILQKQITGDAWSVNISDLESGIYIVKVLLDKQIYTGKIIKY